MWSWSLSTLLLVLGILLAPLATDAQQAKRVPRIGFLGTTATHPHYEAFRQGLRDLGYIEGRTIVIEWRWWEGKPERIPGLVRELAALKLDLIVTAGTPATRAAHAAITTVPVVFSAVGDPIGLGLVANLRQPGGNLTGLTIHEPKLTGKQIELLRETVPRLVRLAVLSDPSNPHPTFWREAEAAAQAFAVKLYRSEAGDVGQLETAFGEMTREHVQAVVVSSNPFFFIERARIAALAAKSRLPAVSAFRGEAEAGLLMSYGPALPALHRRAAAYVDKILQGAKPADLPVEQPTTFELVVNLKTAKALGLSVPRSVLIRADHVIE